MDTASLDSALIIQHSPFPALLPCSAPPPRMYNSAMPESQLSHLDEQGNARMVDVSHKPVTAREARAEGFVLMSPATLRAIADESVPKGEVLNTARIAGILAAKRCGELIPLCHPLPIESVEVHFDVPELEPDRAEPVRLDIKAIGRITAKTGGEIEALTGGAVGGPSLIAKAT